MVSEFSGLGTLEPNIDSMTKYRLWVANRYIDTNSNVPLYIFFSNFSDKHLILPTKMVLAYFSPNPLTMVTLPARIAEKVGGFLCIPLVTTTEDPDI